jgi:hypothetical protein
MSAQILRPKEPVRLVKGVFRQKLCCQERISHTAAMVSNHITNPSERL